jgi:hypothetical protein
MQLRTALRTWIVCVFVILFIATTYVVASEPDEALIPLKDLPAACMKAKAEFRPITQTDVEQAKTILLEALGRLDQRLTLAGPNGENWRKYLRWGVLQDELRGDKQPNKVLLDEVYKRYMAAEDGLDLVWFLDVQHALRNYMFMVAAVGNPQVRAAYDAMLDKLAATLEAYTDKPTADAALLIGQSVQRLDDAGQAPALVHAIQYHFVHPNLLLAISSDVVGAGIADCVDDVTPVRDCILGTDICATAHTTGQTCVATVPDPNFGVIDTLFFGTTLSESVGYHHPVTIFSSSTTSLSARKRLWIDAGGLSSYPAAACAETAICVRDIQSDKCRRMIERMAWKRAGKQQSQAECIASRHAESRLNERVDSQAAESLDRANEAYVEKFQRPLTDRKLFPQVLRFSTTEKALEVLSLQAGGGKLGAPGAPPPVVEGAEMSLRLHESMINNLALDALGGRTVHEDKLQAAVTDLLGHLPEKMKGDEDGQPFAVTFARQKPISVSFADDGFKITIRGVEYRKGNNSSSAMDISAAYKIEQSPKGFKAVRQGDIEIFPPGFVPGKSPQLDAQRQIMRTLLKKRFAKVFEPEFLGEGLELPGKWKAAGKMLPIQVECRDGWLVIAWKRAAAEPTVAAVK